MIEDTSMEPYRTHPVVPRASAGALALVLLLLLWPVRSAAQAGDSVTVVAGPRYQAGAVQRLLLGEDYRDLWTTPIRVPVLDLDTFAGGLTPVRTGGNIQTVALRFRGADGREYNFRSADKELTPALPPYAKETLVDWIRQDQTSAQMPAAPVVAAALLDAVGVLHPGPRLVVLPDDPALGEFREQYAGMLGTIEVHPNEGEDGEPLFGGSVRIAETETVLEHLEEDGPTHRADAREFLKARLMDVFLGDWDRHAGQWRWARYERNGIYWWVPIPEDRDYAFVDYDGLLVRLAERAGVNRLVDFRREYPGLLAMMPNSLELNRRLLAGLERPAWDSVATALQAQLTDQVIEGAVRTMPREYWEAGGPALVDKLRARRDRLLEVAEAYYALLARNVEVRATDLADRAEVVRLPGGAVRVRLYAPESEVAADTPYFERVLRPGETDEVRLFLHGGDDTLRVSGGGGKIAVRVVGGGGDDVLEDLAGGPTFFYDARGENRFVRGPRTRVDTRPYEPPADEDGLLPSSARDWGSSRSRFSPWAGWEPHVGLVVGGGPTWTRYGFRYHPYASRTALRALWAPGEQRFGVEYHGLYRRENSPRYLDVRARASNLEATRLLGFGNDSPELDDEEALIWEREAAVDLRWVFPFSDRVALEAGPSARYTDPEASGEAAALIAGDPTLQLGAGAVLRVDTRDAAAFPRSGARAEAGASLYPVVRGEGDAFGRVHARAATYLPLSVLPRDPVLALRAGGERVLGDAPFFEGAFLGGSRTLRGFPAERFAGDGVLFGGAELRAPLTRAKLVLRGDLGASAFVDAGRVWYEGESPGGWHTAVGGGLWFATPPAVVAVEYAHGEVDRLYLRLGLPF